MKLTETKGIKREPSEELETDYSPIDYQDIKLQTSKALLLVLNSGDEDWFPKSQLRKDQNNNLWATNWILEQKLN